MIARTDKRGNQTVINLARDPLCKPWLTGAWSIARIGLDWICHSSSGHAGVAVGSEQAREV